eukprot:g7650.t1
MSFETNDHMMTQDRLNAIQEAGKSVMHALKQHKDGLSLLSQGSVVLGLRSGKLPIQLVQLQSKKNHYNHNNSSSKQSMIDMSQKKSTQNDVYCGTGVTANSCTTNTISNCKSIPVSVNGRIWQPGQMQNSITSTFVPKQKTQTPHSNPQWETVEKSTRMTHGTTPSVALSRAPPLLSDSMQSFHQRRPEVLRMPSSGNGLSHRRGTTKGLNQEPPPMKFSSNGLMNMTIPVITGCVQLQQRRINHHHKSSNEFCKYLDSLPIAKYTASTQNRGLISNIKSNATKLQTIPNGDETLNLVSEDEELIETPRSIDLDPFKDSEELLIHEENEAGKQSEMDEDAVETRTQNNQGNWLKSLETMQPLLDAIEVLREEEEEEEDVKRNQGVSRASFFGHTLIKKGKRSKLGGIRKTGWIRRRSTNDGTLLSSKLAAAHNALQLPSIKETESNSGGSLMTSEAHHIIMNRKKRSIEDDENIESKRRRKSIPSFCCVDDKSAIKGLDKTNSINAQESQQDEEDFALWEFLKQGCDICTTTTTTTTTTTDETDDKHDSSPPDQITTVRKSTRCISIILPESALIMKPAFAHPISDEVWNRVKMCVDGMSKDYVQSMIQRYSLCGFSAALISACSQQ